MVLDSRQARGAIPTLYCRVRRVRRLVFDLCLSLQSSNTGSNVTKRMDDRGRRNLGLQASFPQQRITPVSGQDPEQREFARQSLLR